MLRLTKALILMLYLILNGCSTVPVFHTLHGTTIITNGISSISEEEVWRALEFFAFYFPEFIDGVTEDQIKDILKYTTIHWEPEQFKCYLNNIKQWGPM